MPTVVRRSARGSPRVDARAVAALADRMLLALGLHDAELSVYLTNDQRMRVLNRTYRHRDKPTDVLAFPQGSEPRRSPTERLSLLGDVVISLDTAARQAASRKRPLEAELRLLLAHGLLHLLGHDHATAAEKRRMDAETRRLVRAAPLHAEEARNRRNPARPRSRPKI